MSSSDPPARPETSAGATRYTTEEDVINAERVVYGSARIPTSREFDCAGCGGRTTPDESLLRGPGETQWYHARCKPAPPIARDTETPLTDERLTEITKLVALGAHLSSASASDLLAEIARLTAEKERWRETSAGAICECGHLETQHHFFGGQCLRCECEMYHEVPASPSAASGAQPVLQHEQDQGEKTEC